MTGPTAGEPAASEPARISYEQARTELARVVERLESGAGTLEESLQLWERGEALAATCQAWLDGARERLDAAVANRGQASSADGRGEQA